MKSIRELYRIGIGPSSSHTMGPRKAAELYKERYPEAVAYRVTLYGSLSATGRGHMTDIAVLDVLGHERTEIIWSKEFLPFHPNGMKFECFTLGSQDFSSEWIVFSIGGGALAEEGENSIESPDVYKMNTMTEILQYCEWSGKSYWEYVE